MTSVRSSLNYDSWPLRHLSSSTHRVQSIQFRFPDRTSATFISTRPLNRSKAQRLLCSRRWASDSFDRPPVDVNPPELDWLQLEERFRRIPGEVEAIWSHYESGLVEWSVYASAGDEKRTVERFLNEARIAGRKAARLNVPRKFPSATFTDAADQWLNVVAALVHPATDVSGSGVDERGRSGRGAIEKLVEASQIACARLSSESQQARASDSG